MTGDQDGTERGRGNEIQRRITFKTKMFFEDQMVLISIFHKFGEGSK